MRAAPAAIAGRLHAPWLRSHSRHSLVPYLSFFTDRPSTLFLPRLTFLPRRRGAAAQPCVEGGGAVTQQTPPFPLTFIEQTLILTAY